MHTHYILKRQTQKEEESEKAQEEELVSYQRFGLTFDRLQKTQFIVVIFSGTAYDGITIQKLSSSMMISQWNFPEYFYRVIK
jgi:hypothetical protein